MAAPEERDALAPTARTPEPNTNIRKGGKGVAPKVKNKMLDAMRGLADGARADPFTGQPDPRSLDRMDSRDQYSLCRLVATSTAFNLERKVRHPLHALAHGLQVSEDAACISPGTEIHPLPGLLRNVPDVPRGKAMPWGGGPRAVEEQAAFTDDAMSDDGEGTDAFDQEDVEGLAPSQDVEPTDSGLVSPEAAERLIARWSACLCRCGPDHVCVHNAVHVLGKQGAAAKHAICPSRGWHARLSKCGNGCHWDVELTFACSGEGACDLLACSSASCPSCLHGDAIAPHRSVCCTHNACQGISDASPTLARGLCR